MHKHPGKLDFEDVLAITITLLILGFILFARSCGQDIDPRIAAGI